MNKTTRSLDEVKRRVDTCFAYAIFLTARQEREMSSLITLRRATCLIRLETVIINNCCQLPWHCSWQLWIYKCTEYCTQPIPTRVLSTAMLLCSVLTKPSPLTDRNRHVTDARKWSSHSGRGGERVVIIFCGSTGWTDHEFVLCRINFEK